MISKTKTITEYTWDILPSPEVVAFLDEIRIPWKDLEFTPPPEERKVESLDEWLREAHTAKTTGGAISCDDPRMRVLGFLDPTRNIWFYLGLSRLLSNRELSGQVCGWFESTPEEIFAHLKSPAGRCHLLGDVPDGEPEMPIQELEAIWVAEAEQDKMVEFKWPAWERPAPRHVPPAPRPLPEIS